jgi:hypothetical protein
MDHLHGTARVVCAYLKSVIGMATDRIPKALQGLAAEARKCDSFEEFEKDFLSEIKHGTYWHWTDDPDFKIDPSKGPKDMSSLSSVRVSPGKLMVTSHLEAWSDYGPGGKGRPYAALIDMSDVPRNAYRQVKRGFGNEFFVDEPSKAKVTAVYPRSRAFQVDRARAAMIPQSSQELEKFYERVRGRTVKAADVTTPVDVLYVVHPETILEQLPHIKHVRPFLEKLRSKVSSWPGPVIVSRVNKLYAYKDSTDPDWRREAFEYVDSFLDSMKGDNVTVVTEDRSDPKGIGREAGKVLDDLYLQGRLGKVYVTGCFRGTTNVPVMCVERTVQVLEREYGPEHVEVDNSLTMKAGPIDITKLASAGGSEERYEELAENEKAGTATDSDRQEARRMVDEAAAKAGYTETLYRGDRPGKTKFTGREDKSLTTPGNIFLFEDPKLAKFYTAQRTNYMRDWKTMGPDEGLYALKVDLGSRVLTIDAHDEDWSKIEAPEELGGKEEYPWGLQIDSIAEKARKKGYTAVVVKNVGDQAGWGAQYIVFSASQIKSAEPFVYRDDGKVVPLAHRFVPKKDIRGDVSRRSKVASLYLESAMEIDADKIRGISLQEVRDRKMFGPVWHGAPQERLEKINEEGFKIFVTGPREGDTIHGYPEGDYHGGIPAPVHHLGYGVYFTTSPTIAKRFSSGTMKGLKTYYLDVPRLETINFGAPRTMMKWWVENGYDPELAKMDRVVATVKLTDSLKSKWDAVWFKGKGIHRLLDGDQVCVYDPSRIYVLDPKLSKSGEAGAKVRRKSDGMVGVILKREPIQEEYRHFHGGNEEWMTVKWKKGGTQYNVFPKDVDFL